MQLRVTHLFDNSLKSVQENIKKRSMDGNKDAALDDIHKLMVAKRLANFGLYSLLVLGGVHAVEQATHAEPLPALLEFAAVDALYVYGGTALNDKLSGRAEDRVAKFSRARTGRIMNIASTLEADQLHDYDGADLPGKERLGVKAMIGALAAPVAIASPHVSLRIVAGAAAAVCAVEVILDGPIAQFIVGREKQSMIDQIQSLA